MKEFLGGDAEIQEKINLHACTYKASLTKISVKVKLMPSLQDFSVVNTIVQKNRIDYSLKSNSSAFTYFVLDSILNLQPDEIHDSITDTNYLRERNLSSGHDRGIDAIYIDNDTAENSIVHLFNIKYCGTFDNINNNFPAGEIDKVLNFLRDLFSRNIELKNDINLSLANKVEEIWDLFNNQTPHFQIHIASNYYKGFENNEKNRFERGINEHSFFKIQYHQMADFVSIISRKDKLNVDCKIKAIGKNFFEKSDGEIRALISNFDAKDVIRIVLKNEDMRNNAALDDYNQMKTIEIDENAFEDNVRIYLKQRSKINRNIKQTALSDENHQFFYFNNGITFTCDNFSYNKSIHSPIVEITNLQVVNGSQTIHALYDAFVENSEKISNIDILCRVYQTKSDILSNRIAEYTNSQNPVKTRDIRSIDYVQVLLEKECQQYGYFYERKKGMHQDKPKSNRIDAEKAGQVLMAMFNSMPSEAKNEKRSIFADKYDDIFNDNITAEKVITSVSLFDFIEKEKENNISEKRYLSYSTYWILFLIYEISKHKDTTIERRNFDILKSYYLIALQIIEKLREYEIEHNKLANSVFNEITFFKYNRPRKHFEDNNKWIVDNIILKK